MKETWAKLSIAIKEIQNHNASKLSFEEHYRYAYNMVLFKRESAFLLGLLESAFGQVQSHKSRLTSAKLPLPFLAVILLRVHVTGCRYSTLISRRRSALQRCQGSHSGAPRAACERGHRPNLSPK